MSTINTVKVVTMKSFKEVVNTTKVAVRKARKSGNLFGVDDNEELVCYFAPDTDFAKPINCLLQRKVDEETGEENKWWFAVNGKPAENVAVL